MKFSILFLTHSILMQLFIGQTMHIEEGENAPSQQYKTRMFFNARLEPKDKVISGAGQFSIVDFDNYVNAMDNSTRPVMNMVYIGLADTNIQKRILKWEAETIQYDWLVIPQIGLSMTRDGKPEAHYEHKIAAGDYDPQIIEFCEALKEWDVPAFVRIGYEFNGPWNGYSPATYKESYIKLTNAFRAHQMTKVATVWCATVDYTRNNDFMSYYPGDEYVDWWGIDIFAAEHFTDSLTIAFMDSALKHGKPVMIGETTPRHIGVLDGMESWYAWFKKYFDFIHQYPQIKAFSYINTDWSTTFLPDWGDCRLEANEYVKTQFLNEMKSDLYLHGAPEIETLNYLNISY